MTLNEAQQRYNTLQKQSWTAVSFFNCLERDRSVGSLSYIYWRMQVKWQVSPALRQTLVCAAFQFSTQRPLSLHLPVNVRGVGSADRTSAIGLDVEEKNPI